MSTNTRAAAATARKAEWNQAIAEGRIVRIEVGDSISMTKYGTADEAREALRVAELSNLNARLVVMPTCPGCSGTSSAASSTHQHVRRCDRCGGVFSLEAAGNEIFDFVRFGEPMLDNAGPAGSFYFDFMIGVPLERGGGVRRSHGWADKATRRVVQFG